MNQELFSYVREAIGSGSSTQGIRSALIGAGWPAADVDAAIAAAAAPTPPAPPPQAAAPVMQPAAAMQQRPSPAGPPAYVSDPKTRKRALFVLLAPFIVLVLTLVAYAVSSSMLASRANEENAMMSDVLMPPVRSAPGSIDLGLKAAPPTLSLGRQTSADRTAGIVRAILGLVGILCVIGIVIGLPIGIILLLKKKLDPNAPYDARSGQGRSSPVPDEIKGWNWGAAGLVWIWGAYYSAWVSLLTFIPVIGIIVMIYLGAKGNAIAWKKNRWPSVEAFKVSQDKWRIAGLIFFILNLLSMLGQAAVTASSLFTVLTFISMARSAAF